MVVVVSSGGEAGWEANGVRVKSREDAVVASVASVQTRSIAELVGSKALVELRLPFPGKSAAWRLASGHGRCIQGVNGSSTHRGTLAYSFDFKLAVGTPVLAVRSGRVAALVSHFNGGGARAHLAPRANFMALKHDDGSYSRYYHLKQDGCAARLGDAVVAGQVIGYSGNTGYTGGPHLHFDLVNVLPEETSTLEVVADGASVSVPSIAAAFSSRLPEPSSPLRARLRLFPGDVAWADVAAQAKKTDHIFVGLADRDPATTFAQRIAALASVGASAAIIANNRSGPEMFAMGGCEDPAAIPAVLVSKESAAWLKAQLAKGTVDVTLAAHPAVARALPLSDQVSGLTSVPHSCVYGPKLRYVTRTLPVQFVYTHKRRKKPFVPVQARVYPPIFQPCRVCSCARRDVLNQTKDDMPSRRHPSDDVDLVNRPVHTQDDDNNDPLP